MNIENRSLLYELNFFFVCNSWLNHTVSLNLRKAIYQTDVCLQQNLTTELSSLLSRVRTINEKFKKTEAVKINE